VVITDTTTTLDQTVTHGQGTSAPVWLYDPFCYTPWYTAELASALTSLGINLRLLCGTLAREPNYFQQRSLSPEICFSPLSRMPDMGLRPINRLLRLTQAMATIRMLIASLRDETAQHPKVLHLQQLPMLEHGLEGDFSLIDAAKNRGVLVIHTVHNLLPHSAGEQAHFRYRKLYRLVDHLICHSTYAADQLTREFGVNEYHISIIPHGPLFPSTSGNSENDMRLARERLGLPFDRPIVLWQGIMAEYKGLDVLLEAWRRYIDLMHDAKNAQPLLLLAGTGSKVIESMVRQHIHEMPTSVRAEIRYLTARELPDFYTAADVLVYPYRAITTSGALLTGLSYGKPIIASNLPAFHDFLVADENALLVEPRSIEAWGMALRRILADFASRKSSGPGHLPQNIFKQLSEGAALNQTRYMNWNSIATQTLALYDRLTH
jgi:glycosyltransferase involved in cell wall biosynthesis